MGAGLSGLACAITLKKHGLTPQVFEKRSRVGDRFVNGEILLSVLTKPVGDCIQYFSKQFDLHFQPIGNIKKMHILSENNSTVIEGMLGFSNLRGRDEDSFENQLARQFNGNIIFNSTKSYEELLEEFTHVVLSTGDSAYATKIQPYEVDLTVTLKGATIEGDFDRYTVATWLDNNIAPLGYSYLIPLSEKEANVVIAYPDYPQSENYDIDRLWSKFLYKLKDFLKFKFKITDNFEVSKYIIGTCKYPRIGNTYFTGNCFGSIMPFLGFGQFSAIQTGVYAAYDILGIGNYEDLTRELKESYKNSLILRKAMEKMSNENFDTLVSTLDTKLGRKIFDNNSMDYLKFASTLLKPFM